MANLLHILWWWSSTFALRLLYDSSTAATTILNGRGEETDFTHWLPRHIQPEGGLFLLDRRALAEGEVLLFRTKKSRHRAIAVMSVASQPHTQRQLNPLASRFSDALTFKDWLRRVYNSDEDKALKVSVRTTEVVRPVLQHLYATRSRFRAPIIVHANTFTGAGPSGQQQKPVDAVHFVDSVRQLLPDAVISLGWTPSEDWAAVNHLGWPQAFQLLRLLNSLGPGQPTMLNMRLNDAVHSAEVLEWLLGVERPAIFLVLHGDVGDFVDSDSPLKRLVRLSGTGRLLFDVDESWRSRIRRFTPRTKDDAGWKEQKQPIGHLAPGRWLNRRFASSAQPPLSTSVLGPLGVAFLGWPNSLLLSTLRPSPFPARQRLQGRVMFLARGGGQRRSQQRRRLQQQIAPQPGTGLVIYLFDQEPESLSSPRVPHSIQVFIDYDGRISLENNNNANNYHYVPELTRLGKRRQRKNDPAALMDVPGKQRRRNNNRTATTTTTMTLKTRVLAAYPESASAQLPAAPCYAFWLLDKGWRVELEAWTERCSEEEETEEDEEGRRKEDWVSQRTFLQLDTPISRNLLSRHVAIGKRGDGAIDFLVRGLEHNGGISTAIPSRLLLLLVIAVLALLTTMLPRCC